MIIKRGRGNRACVDRELKVLRMSCSSPAWPPQDIEANIKFDNIKQKARGNPDTINRIKRPTISNSSMCHSNTAFPVPTVRLFGFPYRFCSDVLHLPWDSKALLRN